jgi:hypothetical protein
MSDLEILHLYQFYNVLKENLNQNKKNTNYSILLNFLRTTQPNIYKILKNSSKNKNLIPNNILINLLEKGYIQNFEDFNSYIISARGIYFIEKKENILNEEIFLNYMEKEYFSTKISKIDLNDREKVILFALILGRSFSIDSSVNLKKKELITNKWYEILKYSFEKLYELDIIKLKFDKIFIGTENVHIVSDLFRHNIKMQEKTIGIYNYGRNQEYYLDLYKNNNFNKDKLSYLFYKIFINKLTINNLDIIINHCNEISSNYSYYLYEKKHVFSQPEYDIIIKDCLINSITLNTKY